MQPGVSNEAPGFFAEGRRFHRAASMARRRGRLVRKEGSGVETLISGRLRANLDAAGGS